MSQGLSQVTVEARKEEESRCQNVPNATTGKISSEVSTDIKMEVWRVFGLLENEVLAIFL
jgi:hypothetical protein